MDAADADELSETFRNDGMQMLLDELLGFGFGLLGDALCIVIGGQSVTDAPRPPYPPNTSYVSSVSTSVSSVYSITVVTVAQYSVRS